MDYTKIPEPLIYQRRKTLHEFIDSNSLIAKLVENMVEIDYLNQYDFESSALNALNTACYICTIIMLDQNPEWRWAFFLRQAANSQNNTIDTDDDEHFVMELVYVLVRRFNKEWCDAHQQLMKQLFEYNFHGYRFDNNPGERAYLDSIHIIIGKLVRNLPAGNLPDDIFAPCDINDDAIKEAEMDMAQMNMGWQELTNDYNSQAINELMEAVCKNDEERALLAKAIIDEADTMQMGYRVDFLRQPLPPTTNTTERPSEAAQLLTRIKELEAENQQLSKKNGELEAENKQISKKNGELEAELKEARTIPSTITALQKVRMELARQLLLKAGANLEKWGNKDKAGTVMSTMLDNILASTCKTYVSYPSINKEYHKETIDEINKQLESLELDFRL